MFTSTHSFSLNAPLTESNAGMWRFHVSLGCIYKVCIHKHMHCVKERVFLFETSALLGGPATCITGGGQDERSRCWQGERRVEGQEGEVSEVLGLQ